jgi:hypothetical protein
MLCMKRSCMSFDETDILSKLGAQLNGSLQGKNKNMNHSIKTHSTPMKSMSNVHLHHLSQFYLTPKLYVAYSQVPESAEALRMVE